MQENRIGETEAPFARFYVRDIRCDLGYDRARSSLAPVAVAAPKNNTEDYLLLPEFRVRPCASTPSTCLSKSLGVLSSAPASRNNIVSVG
ncbi:hypothetical protein SAMN05443245_4204 [Paraburkholderia fungorum]|uniref:Uncharacterized protein n=1 Tax=Paraburkholderia fungorum TaxID=134537 RepID=A0A1H1HRK0_9BURK|nr:hypothetical protein SAMN05443245_4204 [Paraburkholderia fungorum]